MKMIIIGGVLTAALLFAVVSSIKADGPHWLPGGLLADAPSSAGPARANDACCDTLIPGGTARGPLGARV
jgi:hypothetical protein